MIQQVLWIPVSQRATPNPKPLNPEPQTLNNEPSRFPARLIIRCGRKRERLSRGGWHAPAGGGGGAGTNWPLSLSTVKEVGAVGSVYRMLPAVSLTVPAGPHAHQAGL